MIHLTRIFWSVVLLTSLIVLPVCGQQWGSNGTDVFYNDGNVGVGMTSPNHSLDVKGAVRASDELQVTGLNVRLGYEYSPTGTSPHSTLQSNSSYTYIKHNNFWNGTAAERVQQGGAAYLRIGRSKDGWAGDFIFETAPAGAAGTQISGFDPQMKIWHEDRVHIFNDLQVNGKVGLGTLPSEKLSVAGQVLTEGVIVKPQDEWSDYVFETDYDLPTLEEVSTFIEDEGHLPDVPSKESVKENGLRLGDMDATLLQKVEELTLYAIEQEERADSLEARLAIQRERAGRQEARADAHAERLRQLERRIEALHAALRKAGIGTENASKSQSHRPNNR